MSVTECYGVRQLLEAEKKAMGKVHVAKTHKAMKLKKAKEEAAMETQKFKNVYEANFAHLQDETDTKKHEIEKEIAMDIRKELEIIEKNVEENREAVIGRLIELTCDIHPKVHHNLTLRKKIIKDEKEAGVNLPKKDEPLCSCCTHPEDKIKNH